MFASGQIRDRARLLGRELRLAETVAQARPDLAHPEVLLFAGSDLPTSIEQLFVAPPVMTDGFRVPGKPLPKFDLPRLPLFQDQTPIEAPSAFNTEVCDESDPSAAMFEPNFADVVPVGEPLDQTRQIEEPVEAEKMQLSDRVALETFMEDVGMSENQFPYYNEKYLWLITQLQHFTEPSARVSREDRMKFWQVLLNHLPLTSQTPQALEIGFGGVYENIFALMDAGAEVTATELDGDLVRALQRVGAEHADHLHVYKAIDFSKGDDTAEQQFQLVVLNMPLPRDETAENLLSIIEMQTAPGGFVVISTDVPFMYLEQLWNNRAVWEPIMLDQAERLPQFAMLPSRHLHNGGTLAIFRRLPVPPDRVVRGDESITLALQSVAQEGLFSRMWRGLNELFSIGEALGDVESAPKQLEASFPVDGALTEALVLAEEVQKILKSRPGLEKILDAFSPRHNNLLGSLNYLSRSRYRAELSPENVAGLISRLREFIIMVHNDASDAELLEFYAAESIYPEFCDQEYGDTLAKDVDSWRKMGYAIRQYYRP